MVDPAIVVVTGDQCLAVTDVDDLVMAIAGGYELPESVIASRDFLMVDIVVVHIASHNTEEFVLAATSRLSTILDSEVGVILRLRGGDSEYRQQCEQHLQVDPV